MSLYMRLGSLLLVFLMSYNLLLACSGTGNEEIAGFNMCETDASIVFGRDRNSYFVPLPSNGDRPSDAYRINFPIISNKYACVAGAEVEDIILTITLNDVIIDFGGSGLECCENYVSGIFANLYNSCGNGPCDVIGDGLKNGAVGDCAANGEQYQNYTITPHTTVTSCLGNILDDPTEFLSLDIFANFNYVGATGANCNCPQDGVIGTYVFIDFDISVEYIFCSEEIGDACAPVTFPPLGDICDSGGDNNYDEGGLIFLPTPNEGIFGSWSTPSSNASIESGIFLDVTEAGGTTVEAVFTPFDGCSTEPVTISIPVGECCTADGGDIEPDNTQTICNSGGNFQNLFFNGEITNVVAEDFAGFFGNEYWYLLVDANGVIIDNSDEVNDLDFPPNTTTDPQEYRIYGISFKSGDGLGNIINGTTTINIGDASVITNGNGNGLESPPNVNGACMDLSDQWATFIVDPPTMAPMATNISTCSGSTEIIPTGSGTDFNFYDSADLSNLLATGSSYDPNPSAGSSVDIWITEGSGSCESAASIVTVELLEGANAGSSNEIAICTDVNAVIDLFDVLEDSPDTGGIWNDDDGTGVDISDINSVDFSGLVNGDYQFTYTIPANGGCDQSTAIVTVSVGNPVNAGTANTIQICSASNTAINLFDSLNDSPDTNGTWNDDDGTGIDISDPTNVDFIGLANGSYNFTYTITGSGACDTETAILMVEVSAAPNAGTDGSTTLCEGNTTLINLFDLLTDEDPAGSWNDVSGAGVDISDPTSVDFSVSSANSYQFNYTVSNGTCEDSTATATVIVTSLPNPGSNNSVTICQSDNTSYNFYDILSASPSPNGSWMDNSTSGIDLLDASNVNLSSLAPGNYTYTYTISDDGGCTGGSAILSLTVEANPNSGTALPAEIICEDNTTIINLFDLLTDEDSNGTWSETSTTSSTGTAFDATNGTFDPSGQAVATYSFSYALSGGGACLGSSTEVVVMIEANPIVDLGDDIDQCAGDGSINLDAGNNGATFAWTISPDDGNNGATTQSISISDNAIQLNANVTVTQNGCSSTDDISINIYDSPTFSDVATECSDDLNTYSVTFQTNGDQIVPMEGDLIDNMDGTFTVENITRNLDISIDITNSTTNCTSILPVTAPDCGCGTVNSPIGMDVTICSDEGIPALSVSIETGLEVVWYDMAVGGMEIGTGTTYEPTQAGTYYAEAVDPITSCTSDRLAIVFTINDVPTFSEQNTACSPDLLSYSTMIVTDGDQLTATLGDVVNNMDGTFTITNIPEDTNVDITITNTSTNCSSSFSVTAPDCDCGTVNSPIGMDVTICSDAMPSILSVSVETGLEVVWYDMAVGGMEIGTGTTYEPTQAGTYYAEAVDPITSCTSDRLAIVFTINDVPTFSEQNTACSPDLLSYSTMIVTDGDQLTATLGDVVNNMDGTFTITNIPEDTNVDITITNTSTNCSSSFSVTAPDCDCGTVNSPIGMDVTICSDAMPSILSVSVETGLEVVWYDMAVGGMEIGTGTTYEPTQAGTYYAEAVDPITSCTSDRLAIVFTINDVPTFSEQNTACSPDLLSYSTMIVTDGDQLTATLGDVVNNMDGTFTITNIPEDTNVDITITNTSTNCSSSFSVTAPDCGCGTVNAPTGMDVTICSDEGIPALSVSIETGLEVVWYDMAVGGMEIGTGTTYEPTQAGTYYAEAVDPITSCTSDRLAIVFTINDVPTFSEQNTACSPDLLSYSTMIVTDGDQLTATLGDVVDNMDGTFTIENIPEDTNVDITITNTSSNCSSSFSVTAPDCSCPSFEMPTITTTCDDNGTPNNDLDDTFSYTIEVVSIGLGNTFSISGADTQSNLSYDTNSGSLGSFLISDGAITLTITDDANSSCSITNVVIDPPSSCSECVETADAGSAINLNCSNTSDILQGTASSAGQFNWTGPNGFIATNDPNPMVTEGGMYYLTVNFDNGCEEIDSVLVNLDPSNPNADAGLAQSLTCNDPMLQLGGAGTSIGTQYTYVWSGPNNYSSTESNPTISEAGMYTLIVTDIVNNCTSTASMVEIMDETTLPVAEILADPMNIIDCVISTVSLNADQTNDPSVTYNWQFDGMSMNGPSIQVDQSGMYTLEVIDTLTGCINNASLDVINNVDYPIIEFATVNDLDCNNPMALLDASASQSSTTISYEWMTLNNDVLSTDATLAIENGGSYIFQSSDADNGCVNADTLIVGENFDMPNVEAGEDQTVDCVEMTAQLAGSTSTPNSSIQWSPQTSISIGETSATPTVNAANWYYMTVTDENNGCIAVDSVFVDSPPMLESAALQINQPACGALSTGAFLIDGVEGGTGPFLYSLEGSSFTNNTSYANLTPATYDLQIEDTNGCLWDTTIVIEQGIELVLDLGNDLQLNLGDSIQLNPVLNVANNTIEMVNWTAVESISCNDCLTPWLAPSNSTTYFVEIIDENGCVASDEITILVERNLDVYIPNVFSPNDDGINDIFSVLAGSNVIEVKTLQIFNRWGDQVYQADNYAVDINRGWDGRFRNKEAATGVYIYFTEIEFVDGSTQIFQGEVTLAR